jgi:anti-sigma factor RsiW
MTHPSDESLNEYLDKVLAPPDYSAVELHLAACPACAARLTEFRTLFASLDLLPKKTLEVDLVSRVLSRLPHSEALPRSVRWLAVTQVVAVIIALAVAWPLVIAVFPVEIIPPLPSLSDWLASLALGFRTAGAFQLPTFSFDIPSFALDIPSATLTIAVLGISVLWLISNSLLLIPRSRRHP